MIARNKITRRRGRASAAGRSVHPGLRAGMLGLPLLLAAGAAPAMATQLFNNSNIYGVSNGPPQPTIVTLPASQVSQIVTYHWNGGRGAAPGSITLRDSTCHDHGPFRVQATSGQNNAPNVNWIANVNVQLPADNYAVLDSSPSTWSYNAQSHNWGFTTITGNVLSNGGAIFAPYPTRCLTYSAGPAAGNPGGNPGGVIPVSFPPSPGPSLPSSCPNSGGADPFMMNPACQGPSGTRITLVVSKPLPAAISGIAFGPGPIGSSHYGGIGPLMAVPGAALFKPAIPLSIPANAAVGSRYSFAAPPGLCVSAGKYWAWDVWLLHPNGSRQGDVGTFIATGC